jgi:hypothetical protein
MPLLEVSRPLVARIAPEAMGYAPISTQEMQAMLLDTTSSTIVTLTALTIPEYNKTGFEYTNNILKLARVNGMLNWVYKKSVNNQREREGLEPDFEPLPRSWGTQLDRPGADGKKTCFISHVLKNTGEHKLYLKFKVHRVLDVQYLTLDYQEIPTEVVTPFSREKNHGERQGVDNPVIERDYTVKNLLAVAYNGMGYFLT